MWHLDAGLHFSPFLQMRPQSARSAVPRSSLLPCYVSLVASLFNQVFPFASHEVLGGLSGAPTFGFTGFCPGLLFVPSMRTRRLTSRRGQARGHTWIRQRERQDAPKRANLINTQAQLCVGALFNNSPEFSH